MKEREKLEDWEEPLKWANTVSFKKEKTEKMDAEESMGRRSCQILQSLQKSSTHDKSKKEALRKKLRQTNKAWRL